MPEPLRPDDPTRIGSYDLTGRLGEGGQGVVYLGRRQSGSPVAVKLLRAQFADDGPARSRFVRELTVAERVAGFCTAKVVDADLAGDRPYIVSEYVHGPSLLEDVHTRGPRGGTELDRLAIGTATALAAIHRAEVVHRDFKPANVLLGPDGPRVIDFGIARALDASSTVSSQVVGTPAYMAPEQVAAGEIGPAADMWAWAGTLAYAATGRPPFGSDSIPAVLNRIVHGEPDLGGLGGTLRDLAAACLDRDPAQRPTAEETLLRLLGLQGTTAPAAAPGDVLAEGAALATGPVQPASDTPQTGPPRTEGLPAASPQTGRLQTGQPQTDPPQAWPPASRLEVPAYSPATAPGGGGRSRRRWLIPLLAAAAAVAIGLPIAIVSLLPDRSATGGTATTTARLGFLGPVSGDYAALGTAARNAAQLAVEEHNASRPAVRATLTSYDTQGQEGNAVEAIAQKVAGQDLAGVIGPILSGESMTAARVLEQAKVPSITPSASATGLGDRGFVYWHRLVGSDTATAAGLADYLARAYKPGRAVVVDDGTPYGREIVRSAKARLTARSISVTEVNIHPQATNHTPAAKQIKNAKPNVIFFAGNHIAAGRLLAQLRRAGVRAPFSAGDAILDKAFVTTAGRANAQGALAACSCLQASLSDARAVKDFAARYKTRFGAEPGIYAAEGYDAAKALLWAVRVGRTTGEAVNSYLATEKFYGISRLVQFTSKGEPAVPATWVYAVRGDDFSLLGDAAKAPRPS